MQSILDFLTDLAANNNREWFAANKSRYVAANEVFNAFATELLAEIQAFDPLTRGLTLRDCTYRIYRDTRFSHDKTPYKTHFGLYVCPDGKKSGNPGYYFHIQPMGDEAAGKGGDGERRANHLMDAGVFMPWPNVLRSVRDEVFDNGTAVLAALKKASKAGFELDQSNSLTRTPKGFPTATELDEYLRMKDFHATKPLSEEHLLAPDLARRAARDFQTTYEFMALMQRAARFAHDEDGYEPPKVERRRN